MNHCLHIPEIVFLICSHVSDDMITIGIRGMDDEPYKNHLVPMDYENRDCEVESSRASQLYALARTCRQFQQPALENLWESIPSMVPIIKCAGEDLWKEDSRVELGRPISASDAETMRKYASFVRYINPGDYSEMSLDIWTALRDTFVGAVLFPHLRGIVISGDKMMKCAPLFGTQDLTSLRITAPMSQPSKLIDFFARCPNLVTLHLPHAREPWLLEAAIEALPTWQNLSRLISRGTPDLLQAISHCTRLQHIEFLAVTDEHQWELLPAETNPRTAFPMLQRINITCATVSHAVHFLNILPPTINLQDLDIRTYMHDSTASEDEFLDLIRLLAKYSHSLKKLHVRDMPMYAVPRRRFSNTIFSDLTTHLTKLTHLKISHHGDYDLVDEDIRKLTEALPLLEDISLPIRPITKYLNGLEDHTPGTTMTCLVFFARNCPSLSNLCITFDGSGSIPDCSSQVQGLKLTSLDVSTSPIHGGAEQVAIFLLRLFPNLQRIKWEQYRFTRVEETEKRAYTMRSWSRVSKLLKGKKRLI